MAAIQSYVDEVPPARRELGQIHYHDPDVQLRARSKDDVLDHEEKARYEQRRDFGEGLKHRLRNGTIDPSKVHRFLDPAAMSS